MSLKPRPVEWREIKDGLLRWLRESTGLETIWGQQSAPQPAWPYASMTSGPGPLARGARDEEQWDDGDLNLVGQREFNLSVQIHVGPNDNVEPECDAQALLEGALAALVIPQTIADLAEAGVAIRDRGDPQNLSLAVGAQWISRWQADIRCGFVSLVSPETTPGLDAVGWFDKVEISSDYSGTQDPATGLNLDDELFDPP